MDNRLFNKQISIGADRSNLVRITPAQIGVILGNNSNCSNSYSYTYDKPMGPIVPGRKIFLIKK